MSEHVLTPGEGFTAGFVICETWKQHPVYRDYEVSTHGRVQLLPRRWEKSWRSQTKTLLKQGKDQAGYPRVGIRLGHKTKKVVRVHVLVCETFLGPRPTPKGVVRHLNGVADDNRLENLAWGTAQENANDTVRHGHNALATSTECKYGHEFTPDNTMRGPRDTRECITCPRRRGRETARRMREKKKRQPQEADK